MTLLDASGVVAGYGEAEILHGVSITVAEGRDCHDHRPQRVRGSPL